MGTIFFSWRQAKIHPGSTTGNVSWSARWYSTLGPLPVGPAGVVHTKWVVSIWILSE